MATNNTTASSSPSISTANENSAPFALLTAFSGTPFSGNPAAVVFLDPTNTPRKVLEGLAGNFNAPMIAFVGCVDEGSVVHVDLDGDGGGGDRDVNGEREREVKGGRGRVVIKTSIRYLTYSGVEIPLCGHASVAAAGAILRLPFVQDLVRGGEKGESESESGSARGGEQGDKGVVVERVEFETWAEGRKVPVRVYDEDGKTLYELGLPSLPPLPLPKDEEDRIRAFVACVFGERIRDVDRDVVCVRRGVGGMEHAILVELDASVGLEDADVDVNVFTDCGYTQNVITSLPSPAASTGPNDATSTSTGTNNPTSTGPNADKPKFDYVYRMFSPHVPGGEDAVCGSAQCLLAPYWYAKLPLQLGRRDVVPGTEVTSYSASPRGGVVKVVWETDRDVARDGGEEKERVLLRGEVALLASGECYF